MDDLDFLVLLFLLLSAALGAAAAVTLLRPSRARRATSGTRSEEECAACANRTLSLIAPHVYRCGECGFIDGASAPSLRRAAH